MRNRLLSLVTGLGLLAGGFTVGIGDTWQTVEQPGQQTVVSGCVLRFLPEDTGRPSIHANGAHLCAGVESVTINQHGHVQVSQTIDDPSEHAILFVTAQPDESLVTRGITAGASGGTGTTRFWLYDHKLGRQLDLTDRADRDRVSCSTCNLWVGWVHAPREQIVREG